MSSSWGSGEGLSFKGEVLGPAGGFVGALNGIGGGGGGSWDGCGGRGGCCSIRAWILLLPSALKWETVCKLEGQKQWFSDLPQLPSSWKHLQSPRLQKTEFYHTNYSFYFIPVLHHAPETDGYHTCCPQGVHVFFIKQQLRHWGRIYCDSDNRICNYSTSAHYKVITTCKCVIKEN